MTSMIERVARAIAQVVEVRHAIDPDERDHTAESWADAAARAAIEAMREPTETMWAVVTEIGIDQPAEEYWKGMINAALKEER